MNCPYRIIDENHKYYPYNTCTKVWNYCNCIIDYRECDIYKRASIITNKMKELMEKTIYEKR